MTDHRSRVVFYYKEILQSDKEVVVMSMNGGDAAEQMVRILLDGTETVVKITGEGARQLAAFLYARAQQEPGKNPAQHGRTSMVRLLKSGQELQVFRLRKEEYAAFKPQARQYKLLYAVLRNRRDPDGLIDVVVRTDEIPRVNHVLERLGYGSVQQGENSKKKKNLRRREARALQGTGRGARQRTQTAVVSVRHPLGRGWSCIGRRRRSRRGVCP